MRYPTYFVLNWKDKEKKKEKGEKIQTRIAAFLKTLGGSTASYH